MHVNQVSTGLKLTTPVTLAPFHKSDDNMIEQWEFMVPSRGLIIFSYRGSEGK